MDLICHYPGFVLPPRVRSFEIVDHVVDGGERRIEFFCARNLGVLDCGGVASELVDECEGAGKGGVNGGLVGGKDGRCGWGDKR